MIFTIRTKMKYSLSSDRAYIKCPTFTQKHSNFKGSPTAFLMAFKRADRAGSGEWRKLSGQTVYLDDLPACARIISTGYFVTLVVKVNDSL